MPAFLPSPRRGWVPWLLGMALAAVSCGKREEPPRPPEQSLPRQAPAPEPIVEAESAVPDSVAAGPDTGSPAPELHFVSHPPQARLGKPFSYKPAFDFSGAVSLALARPADSSMRLERGRLEWVPSAPGRYAVEIEAAAGGMKARQAFALVVAPVLKLSLNPPPPKAGKGDTLAFDLRGSAWPAWAAPDVALRFDWEGDGAWDEETKPGKPPLVRHAYAAPGRYAPRIEARYGAWETREARCSVDVVSPVTAVLEISPDTVEPGAEYRVDAAGSRSDGRLVYFFDAEGDGKWDWIDSSSGRAVLKAPASGVYRSRLLARNRMGEEGAADALLRVNARPRIEFRIRKARDHMAAGIDFKIAASDADDSLRRVRFTYDGKQWEERPQPDSGSPPGEWRLRLKHVFGRVGKFAPRACALSADGREACAGASVEIFNAPPECRPGGDLKATIGVPVAIDGDGYDPDGKIVRWEWDLDGDGKYDLVSSENGRFQYTFGRAGIFDLVLRVTTADGMTATGKRKAEVRKKWKS